MLTAPPWLPTALAVALAVVAAVCFASAAFLQQGSVAQDVTAHGGTGTAGTNRVGMDALRRLVRQPRWLSGWALIGAGTLLHVSALLLAPIGVVQPVGILAVPVGVVLAARAVRERPPPRVIVGVVLAVAGTVAFVVLASVGVAPTSVPATASGIGSGLLVVAAAVGGLRLAAIQVSGPLRCVAYAGIGAVGYGFGSALIRVIARATAGNVGALLSPLVILVGLTLACSITVGAWAVQQAYAAGPAPVVTSALTVGDPLVAILLSAGLFGEGLHQGSAALAAVVVSAVIAAGGVWLLARHQPAADPQPSQAPTAALAAVR